MIVQMDEGGDSKIEKLARLKEWRLVAGLSCSVVTASATENF